MGVASQPLHQYLRARAFGSSPMIVPSTPFLHDIYVPRYETCSLGLPANNTKVEHRALEHLISVDVANLIRILMHL